MDQKHYRTLTRNKDTVPTRTICVLLRTRAYLGVKDILDPFRFAVEFENASSENGLYERTDADVNEHELIQGYGELYFKNALGYQPAIKRSRRSHGFGSAGSALDWPITSSVTPPTTFWAIRVHFGKKQNDWDLDTFALATRGTLEIPVGPERRRYLVLWRCTEYPPMVGIYHDPALLHGPQG